MENEMKGKNNLIEAFKNLYIEKMGCDCCTSRNKNEDMSGYLSKMNFINSDYLSEDNATHSQITFTDNNHYKFDFPFEDFLKKESKRIAESTNSEFFTQDEKIVFEEVMDFLEDERVCREFYKNKNKKNLDRMILRHKLMKNRKNSGISFTKIKKNSFNISEDSVLTKKNIINILSRDSSHLLEKKGKNSFEIQIPSTKENFNQEEKKSYLIKSLNLELKEILEKVTEKESDKLQDLKSPIKMIFSGN